MECQVSYLINPSNFWLVDKEADYSFIKKVELVLLEEFKAGGLVHRELDKRTKYVAVQDDKGNFRRGSITDFRNSSCSVFLLDYGHVINVDNSKLFPLDKSVIEDVPPIAIKACLFGVFPTIMEKRPDGTQARKITDTWSEESCNQIRNFFKEYPDVRLKDVEKLNGVVYAEVFVGQKNEGLVSLRKLLVDKYFAVYLPDEFQKRVMGGKRAEKLDLMSNISSKASTLSTLTSCRSDVDSTEGRLNDAKVEKWQRKNEEFKSGSGGSETDTRKRRLELGKEVLKLNRSSKGSKSSDTTDNISPTGSASSLPPVKTSPIFKEGYFTERSPPKPKHVEIMSVDDLDEKFEKDCSIADSESLLHDQMEVTANPEPAIKKSIFDDLLKADRSKVTPQLNFVPAGKLRKNEEKPKKEKTSQSSNKSGSSGGDRFTRRESPRSESGSFKENKSPRGRGREVEPRPRGTSLKNFSCEKKSSSQSFANSVCESSIFKRKQGTLESIKLNKDNVLYEGVPSETWNRKITVLTKPLVLASDYEVEPQDKFFDLKILPDVLGNLHARKVVELKGFQKWALPAILRGSNTVVISGNGTGKTLSYIVSLVDFVQDKRNFEDLPDGNGPYAVVLCSSSKSAKNVYEWCNHLLNIDYQKGKTRKEIKVQYAHGGGAERENWVKLTNGCHILISTPHCLNRLLTHFSITNFERLMYLVVDEADILFDEPYKTEIIAVLQKAKAAARNRTVQKIICGRKWTPEIASFVKTMERNHVLIFGTHLEAAVYARLKPHLWLTEKERKADVLVTKLKEKFGKQKMLIICESPAEAIELQEVIRGECDVPVLIAHESLLSGEIKSVASAYKSSSKNSILLVTDGVLHELQIDDAEMLIHYSLPYKYKTNFGIRFSTMMKNYPRFYASTKSKDNSQAKDLSVYIIVDNENHYQLPHMVDFIQRLGSQVSDKIIDMCDKIKIQKELEKDKLPICPNVLEFGRCSVPKSCSKRHAFSKVKDAAQNLPASGAVIFSVLEVHDACRFSARIIEHIDLNKRKTSWRNEYHKILRGLSKFYKKVELRRPHGLPTLGDVCAVQDEECENIFHRAQVIEYAKLDDHDQPKEVNVRLMDIGSVVTKRNNELYEISEELASYRPQAVDMVLCGLLPTDFDTNFGLPAFELTKKLLMEQDFNEHENWFGRIVLSLNNTLCLDPVQFCEFLPASNTHIFKFTLKDKLLKKAYAVENKNHLQELYKLCEKADIPVPKYELSKPVETAIKPEWDFLRKDFAKCKFLSALDTSTVFLQNMEFVDLLSNLEKECTVEAERIIRRKDHLNFEIVPGKFCLVRDQETKATFNRGRIEAVSDNKDIQVFFVDYGDCQIVKKCDIVPIAEKFITKLPFQAIECSLIGMDHNPQPSEDLMDEIYNFSNNGHDPLYAMIIKNDLKPTSTDGKKYSVNLLSKGSISLNKLLIDKKLVTPNSEKHHAEDIEIAASENEEEEEDDDIDWDEVKAEREKRREEEEMLEKTAEVENPKMETDEGVESPVSESSSSEDVMSTDEGVDFLTEEQINALLEDDDEANLFFQNLMPKTLPHLSSDTGPGVNDIAQKAFPVKNEELLKTTLKKPRLAKSPGSLPPNSLVRQRLLNMGRKPLAKKAQRQPPKVVHPEGILHPEVSWIQNYCEVTMRIQLTDVVDYNFDVSPNCLIFCCSQDGKLYGLELRLFGTVSPTQTEIKVHGRNVEVVLKKLVSEWWPRLVLDKAKHPNIHFDVDRVSTTSKSLVDVLMDRAHERMKAGVDFKKRKIEKVEPVDWDEDDISGDEDVYDPEEDYYKDPHDFLAD